MKKFKSPAHRETYIKRLANEIDDAMSVDQDMRLEAIIEGLNDMDDPELLEFGIDCWSVGVEGVS